MMRIPLVVTYEDGRTEQVKVGAADLIAFERTYDKPTSAISSGRIEYLWWSAWHAAKRTKATGLDFDDWVNTVDAVQDDSDSTSEIVPLESPAPTGS
jgi:hypothetical protein